MKTIEYFVAPASPYVYLGHARLQAIAKRHDARIELKPFDLGGKVFPISGGLPVLDSSSPTAAITWGIEETCWKRRMMRPPSWMTSISGD